MSKAMGRLEKLEFDWYSQCAVTMTGRERQRNIRSQIKQLDEEHGKLETKMEVALDERRKILTTFLWDIPVEHPSFISEFRVLPARARRRPVAVLPLERFAQGWMAGAYSIGWARWRDESGDFVLCQRFGDVLQVWVRPLQEVTLRNALERFDFASLVTEFQKPVAPDPSPLPSP